MKIKILLMNKFLSPLNIMLKNKVEMINFWEHTDTSIPWEEMDGVVSSVWDDINESLIKKLNHLKIIVNMAVGIDNINFNYAINNNIIVANTPDLTTDDTADLAIGMMIAWSRKIIQNDSYVRSGLWEKSPLSLSTSLKNKNIGIVGLGKIGSAIAKRAEAFNLNVFYYGKNDKKYLNYKYMNNILDLASQVKFLIVSCAANDETKGLVNVEVLKHLGKDGVLINVSRGSVVNQSDLIYSLQKKIISGAALDVYESEPNVPIELRKMDNVILQPHVGSATLETRLAMFQLVADNILSFFNNGYALTPIKKETKEHDFR